MKHTINTIDELKTRRPVNQLANSIFWKTPKGSEPVPSFYKQVGGVVKVVDHSSRTNPPPPGVRDKRRWLLGRILVTGYAYPRRIRHKGKTALLHYWFIYCLKCKQDKRDAIGFKLLKYQRRNWACVDCLQKEKSFPLMKDGKRN